MSVTSLQRHRLRRLTGAPDATWQGGWLPVGRLRQEPDGVVDLVLPVWVVPGEHVAGPPATPRPADEASPADLFTALVTMACDPELAGYRPGRVEVCDPDEAEHLAAELAPLGVDVALLEGPVDQLPAMHEFRRHVQRIMAGELGVADTALDDGLEGGSLADLLDRDTDISDVTDVTDLPDLPAFDEALAGLDPLDVLLDDGDVGLALAEVEGMTGARIAAFAQAAMQFHRAAPWRRLDGFDDLVQVTAPEPPPGFAFFSVLGSAGRMRGLGFHPSHDDFRDLVGGGGALRAPRGPGGRRVSVIFEPIERLDARDAAYWRDEVLPLDDDDAHPMAVVVEPSGEAHPPSPVELAFLEGLLRALAATSDEELDRGRWQRTVPTVDGPTTYAFALPELLDPPDPYELSERGYGLDARADEPLPPAGSTDPADRAQELCHEAYAAIGRRRVALARQALALSPGCADAHVILAEDLAAPADRLVHYQAAVAAGLDHLDPAEHDAARGDLWALPRARPFLRALLGLAFTLHEMGRLDEAVARYRELLDHDRADHQYARGRLVRALLDARRDREALDDLRRGGALLPDPDLSADLFAWTEALACFRVARAGDQAGDGADAATGAGADAAPQAATEADADALLTRARRRNRYVRRLLLEPPEHDPDDDSPRPGGRRGDAQVVSLLLGGPWRQTEGAVGWLKGHRLGGKR